MPLRWRSATERILVTSRLRSSPALALAAPWRARARSTRQSRITHRAMADPAGPDEGQAGHSQYTAANTQRDGALGRRPRRVVVSAPATPAPSAPAAPA
jgi:hypothetical protein